MMNKNLLLLILAFCFSLAADPLKLLQDKSVRPGFCVVLGVKNAKALAAYRMNGKYLVQGVVDAGKAREIKKTLVEKGLYGRISVGELKGGKLPYIDNLVNVLVVEDQGKTSREEIIRVLAPYGTALFKEDVGWKKVVKPYPKEMDEWPMFRHDLKRSNVLNDKTIKVPTGLQWVTGKPMAEYMTSQMVTAGGRIFYSRSRQLKNRKFKGKRGLLVARDAFNGLLLWQKELKVAAGWSRSCLALEGNRLYTKIDEGVVALNVATGKILQHYEKAEDREISYHDGKLIMGKGRMVVDAESGEVLWQKKLRTYTSDCLISKGRLITTNKEIVVCLDLATGKEIWRIPLDAQVNLICLWQEMFFATTRMGRKITLYAFQVVDGKKVWQREGRGFPAIIRDQALVYSAEGKLGKKNQQWIILDPRTGEEKQRFPYGTYVKGGRCYLARATENYLLPNFGGLFFFDPAKKEYTDSFAGRGTCWFGYLPGNGLVYQPVHSCVCYPMIRGDAAFSCRELIPAEVAEKQRLKTGPAYDSPVEPNPTEESDWPTWRKDYRRHGVSSNSLAKDLQLKWQAPISGEISPPVIADGKVYVATDRYRVIALDAVSGKQVWQFTADGRIDSPPTIAGNLVLFGSADGLAYCLDSEDGALRWRFQAEPMNRKIISHEQVASLWPVHGNLLAVDGKVFVAAGWQAELNGGISLYGLDAASGKILWQRKVVRPDLYENRSGWSVDSGNNRLMTSDGESLQLDRHFYDLATGEERKSIKEMSLWGGTMGFRVDNVNLGECHKSERFKYWAYRHISGHQKQTKQLQIWSRNKGNILAVKGNQVFGIRQYQHLLFAGEAEAENMTPGKPDDDHWLWQVKMPEDTVLKAIIISGETVVVGGLAGEAGKIWQFSAKNGDKISEIALPAIPRFDGLAAAGEKLYIATQSGEILCLGK